MILALGFFAAPFLLGPGLGSVLRRYDRWKTARQREFNRVIRFPAILARVEPTPWPVADDPSAPLPPTLAPVPAACTDESGHAIETEQREQVIQITVDVHGCPVPCTARHCIYHAGIVGSIAQRWRWNTDTAEWSLLGLKVPDFPPLRSAVYEEAM